MNDTTLIIPAKYEPNSLPLVLDEIKNKRLKLKIIIILDKDDSDTLNAIKNYDCEIIYQSKKGYGNAIIDGLKNSKTKKTLGRIFQNIQKSSSETVCFFWSNYLSHFVQASRFKFGNFRK